MSHSQPDIPIRVIGYGDKLYVDTAFISAVGGHQSGLGWAVQHLGMGDFRVTNPGDEVEFDCSRIDGTSRATVLAGVYEGIGWPSGRPHEVYLPPGRSITAREFKEILQSAALMKGLRSQWFDAPPKVS